MAVYNPNAPKAPDAVVDAAAIVFRCFNEKLSPDVALEELHSAGASQETIESVRQKYEDLTRIRKKWGFSH